MISAGILVLVFCRPQRTFLKERPADMSVREMPAPVTPSLIGESQAIRRVRFDIESAARTHAKVLIGGETGVGKEVAARMIHDLSARRSRAFIAVNCSGIPETLLESELFGHTRGSFTGAYRDKIGIVRQADRGTLFLDELGEMSLRMQAALLRFTETGEIRSVGAEGPTALADVRLITATNRDLRAQITAGAFREDLYYRLNVIQIHIPPLRDRGDDILLLLAHYLEHAARVHGVEPPQLTPDTAQLFLAYRWPGNVRELRNVTERLVVRHPARPVMPEDLPGEILNADRAATSVAVGSRVKLPVVSAASHGHANAAKLQALWDRLEAGEDFWTVVRQAFKARELTRAELATLIDRGLQKTHGSYRALLKVFHLHPTDYKRFHAFLYQHQCNLPVKAYRNLRVMPSGLKSRGETNAP